MSAVEDTREARERANRLLDEVQRGRIELADDGTYVRWSPGTTGISGAGTALAGDEQQAVLELVGLGLVCPADGRRDDVVLTDKGRAVLGAPAALPSPPPLLCDSSVHGPRPAVMICAVTTGPMATSAQCADCAQRYALNAASLAVAAFGLDPSAPPVAIHLIPLPQPERPDLR